VERYQNLGGNSGVLSFEIGMGSLAVMFSDGKHYLYTNESAGGASIAEMQRLARIGRGLNSYITRVVKTGYARKW
jgi:hypothetical protein